LEKFPLSKLLQLPKALKILIFLLIHVSPVLPNVRAFFLGIPVCLALPIVKSFELLPSIMAAN